MSYKTRHAIFLDRDGVIVNPVIRNNQPAAPWSMEDFSLTKDAKEVCRSLYMCGYDLFVVSNQPDVARGNLDLKTLDKMNTYLHEELPLREILNCIHDDEDECLCRKPNPGMINILEELYDIDKSRSFMIGDGWRDCGAANLADVRMILLRKKYNFIDRFTNFISDDPLFEYKSVWTLKGAMNWILSNDKII